ncbi:MAG: protein arginine kinase [Planctomycetota bacterium]
MGISDPTGPTGPTGQGPWLEALDFQQTPWLMQSAESDVVVSSRVRLARNLAGFRFVARADVADRAAVLELVRSRLGKAEFPNRGRAAWIDIHALERQDRDLLVERHLISPHLARGLKSASSTNASDPRAVVVSLPDECLSIMVNEEDHLRLQSLRPGLALEQAYADVDGADDLIERTIDYAYDPRFGYLTACPTNVGSGIRLSVMLHLPALRMLGEIEKVKRAANDMSLAVRGFWGEGSDADGDFYQISNQTTLGRTESVMLDDLQRTIVPRVIDYERRARERLLSQRRLLLEDTVYRSLGVMQNARRMATSEAMQRLSEIRLGATLGLLESPSLDEISQLLMLIHPAHLQRTLGRALAQDERRVERATLLRHRLAQPPG